MLRYFCWNKAPSVIVFPNRVYIWSIAPHDTNLESTLRFVDIVIWKTNWCISMTSIIHHITLKREFGNEKPKMSYPNMEFLLVKNTELVNQLDHSQQFGCKLVFWQDDESGETFWRHFCFCPIGTPILLFKLGTSGLLCCSHTDPRVNCMYTKEYYSLRSGMWSGTFFWHFHSTVLCALGTVLACTVRYFRPPHHDCFRHPRQEGMESTYMIERARAISTEQLPIFPWVQILFFYIIGPVWRGIWWIKLNAPLLYSAIYTRPKDSTVCMHQYAYSHELAGAVRVVE